MVHANQSDTWLSILLQELYYRTPSSFPCLEHTCTHTHTQTHTHTHVHAYTHTCTHIHTHTCAHARTHTCTYTHLAYADINRYNTRNDRFTQKSSSSSQSSSSSPHNWPAVFATSWGLGATLCLTLRLQLQLLLQVGQLFLILLLGGWDRREKVHVQTSEKEKINDTNYGCFTNRCSWFITCTLQHVTACPTYSKGT